MQGSSLSCCPKRPGRGRGRRRGCRTKWDCIEAGHHRVAPGLHVQEPQVLVVLGVGELHHCVIWLPSNSSIGLPRRRCTRNCERMAAPGAWKADADTSGATSPPPSSWVGHAGIGNCVNQRCENPISFCCRRRSGRYFDTVYIMFATSCTRLYILFKLPSIKE